MNARYWSRKFLLAVAAFLAGVVFICVHWFTAEQWINYTQWLLGLYFAANVGQKATAAKP